MAIDTWHRRSAIETNAKRPPCPPTSRSGRRPLADTRSHAAGTGTYACRHASRSRRAVARGLAARRLVAAIGADVLWDRPRGPQHAPNRSSGRSLCDRALRDRRANGSGRPRRAHARHDLSADRSAISTERDRLVAPCEPARARRSALFRWRSRGSHMSAHRAGVRRWAAGFRVGCLQGRRASLPEEIRAYVETTNRRQGGGTHEIQRPPRAGPW